MGRTAPAASNPPPDRPVPGGGAGSSLDDLIARPIARNSGTASPPVALESEQDARNGPSGFVAEMMRTRSPEPSAPLTSKEIASPSTGRARTSAARGPRRGPWTEPSEPRGHSAAMPRLSPMTTAVLKIASMVDPSRSDDERGLRARLPSPLSGSGPARRAQDSIGRSRPRTRAVMAVVSASSPLGDGPRSSPARAVGGVASPGRGRRGRGWNRAPATIMVRIAAGRASDPPTQCRPSRSIPAEQRVPCSCPERPSSRS